MNKKKPDKTIVINELKDVKMIPPDLAKTIAPGKGSDSAAADNLNNKRFKRSRPVFWWNIFINEFGRSYDAVFNNGIHYIDGSTGSGKTLLMNIIQRQLLNNKGFMYSSVDEFHTDKIKVFDMYKIWKDGTTQYKLPSFLPGLGSNKGIIFDEINRIFNRRLNRLNVYNDVFIPLVNWCITHRHKKIPRIYFIGQNLQLQDVQLQLIIKYQHIVESKYKYYYYFWKSKLILIKAPYRITVRHYIKDKSSEKFIPFGKSIFKVTLEDLITYNTHGFEKDDDKLPVFSAFQK